MRSGYVTHFRITPAVAADPLVLNVVRAFAEAEIEFEGKVTVSGLPGPLTDVVGRLVAHVTRLGWRPCVRPAGDALVVTAHPRP